MLPKPATNAPGPTLRTQVAVDVSPATLTQLERLARKYGQPLSEYLEDLLAVAIDSESANEARWRQAAWEMGP